MKNEIHIVVNTKYGDPERVADSVIEALERVAPGKTSLLNRILARLFGIIIGNINVTINEL